jgi:hypothetical protein
VSLASRAQPSSVVGDHLGGDRRVAHGAQQHRGRAGLAEGAVTAWNEHDLNAPVRFDNGHQLVVRHERP